MIDDLQTALVKAGAVKVTVDGIRPLLCGKSSRETEAEVDEGGVALVWGHVE